MGNGGLLVVAERTRMKELDQNNERTETNLQKMKSYCAIMPTQSNGIFRL